MLSLVVFLLSLSAVHSYRLGQRLFMSTVSPKVDLKLVSLNILAPCYHKKVDADKNVTYMESEKEEEWYQRNTELCRNLINTNADIVCIQEFWLANDKLKELYYNEFRKNGYSALELIRTSHWRTRPDGLVVMVKGNGDRLVVQDTKDILFHDCGDRVAQMLLLAIRSDDNSDLYQQFMLVNTHLLFPHNQYSTKIRLREMTKIMGFTETYRQRELCTTVCGRSDVKIPIIICGDFNGSPKGEVYKYVKSQNYKSIYEDCDVIPLDKAITHRSHLNKNVLVDHVMFLNPADQTVEKLPLLPDWTNLVFREIIEKMTVKYGRQSGREDVIKNLFSEFYQDNMNYVSKDDFIRALQKLGFSGEGNPTLTPEEIEMLIDSADKNGDGLIDYKEFYDRFWLASNAPQENNIRSNFFARSDWLSTGMGKSQSTPAGEASKDTNTASPQPVIESKFLEKVRPLGNISVKDLRLFPSELIDGIFPTEWGSDHGMVEVTFTGEVLPL